MVEKSIIAFMPPIYSRTNIMTTFLKYKTSAQSFFIKMILNIKHTCINIKRHYIPLEEYQTRLYFNDNMRHCPASRSEIEMINNIVHDMFGEIKDTPLFKAMLLDLPFANIALCKTWKTGNVGTLPSYLDAPFSNVITDCADRMSLTTWVLWFEDRVEIVHPHQNRGVFRTGRETITINDKPDCMPKDVIKAAQVTLGVVQAESNTLRGFQWKLYR